MAVRDVITIDQELCNGCGQCIPGCPEGALQVIDGKARLVSDLFCDGLGACIGTCPQGAISVEKREAQPYDEKRVMENIVPQGANTIAAHLKHLTDHNQDKFYNQALQYLEDQGIENPLKNLSAPEKPDSCAPGKCPGSRIMQFDPVSVPSGPSGEEGPSPAGRPVSQLRQWPVQLALLNPDAPYFDNADLLFAADCVPFAYPDFHQRFLKGRILVMFCPKLDHDLQGYVDKLTRIFKNHNINSAAIVRMEVPCCGGVEKVVESALRRSGKNVIIKEYTISIQGEII